MTESNVLANKVHIQGVTLYWLTKCTNKNHIVNGYVSHNHSYLSSSDMADATIFYCYTYVGMVV